MNAARHKEEVSHIEFEQFVKNYPRPLAFDGTSYTEDVSRGGILWHKPVAIKQDGKFFVVRDS